MTGTTTHAELAELLARMELARDWWQPGGKTPKKRAPNRYTMIVDAISEIHRLTTELVTARAEEREACAAACEQQGKALLSPEYATGQPLSSMMERFACAQCATIIRGRGERDGAS